ncbi:hypothetical protein ABVT39_018302 [Epinephelus coioides]
MNTFTLMTVLSLFSYSWISVSVSETVDVQSGEDVTLQCSNMVKRESVTLWFRLVNKTKASCISVMFRADEDAEYCEGFQNGKFKMRSDSSTTYLIIKQVDLSDSGLYFCGFYKEGRLFFSVIHLNVKGSSEPHDDEEYNCKKESEGIAKLSSVILGALTVVLVIVIVGLIVKNRKLQTGWISVSVSETVDVQSGEDVTLQCSNMVKRESVTLWFRLVNKTKASCISVMFRADEDAEYCEGFQNGKFKMRSDSSTTSLIIKQMDLSDSGLYFCGFYTEGRLFFSVIHLHVKEESDGKAKLSSVILGALTVVLVMVIIVLVVKNRKLQTAAREGPNPQQHETLGSDGLKDAALALCLPTVRNRRPASQREVETHVIYAARR